MTDFLAKLLPLMSIIPGYVTRSLHYANWTSGQDQPFEVKTGEKDIDALIDSPEDILLGNLAVFKYEFTGP